MNSIAVAAFRRKKKMMMMNSGSKEIVKTFNIDDLQ